MTCVVVLAAGAAWESAAVSALDRQPGTVVLRRCMDVEDLMAAATSGQVDVAVVALDVPGLDPAAVEHLRRHDVRPVGVVTGDVDEPEARERAARLDVRVLVPADRPHELAEAVGTVEDVADTRVAPGPAAPRATAEDEPDEWPAAVGEHRVVAVWGPGGAPGRTTVALNLAAEVARRQVPVLLVDADPWGGSVAQHLGVLDEVSGLLSVARLAGTGHLSEHWTSACRSTGEHLAVLTGLPRAERWREVRPAHLEQVLGLAARRTHVVVDTGFALEDDPAVLGSRPSRNSLTLTSLDLADEVVVVGSADPVGLARLARGLVTLRERVPSVPTRVVVNRMRPSIGWSEREIAGMVEGFARIAGLHFLAEDRAGLDRAMVTGRPLVEVGDGALVRGLGALADAVFPDTVDAGPGPRRTRVRRRTAGRARPR